MVVDKTQRLELSLDEEVVQVAKVAQEVEVKAVQVERVVQAEKAVQYPAQELPEGVP